MWQGNGMPVLFYTLLPGFVNVLTNNHVVSVSPLWHVNNRTVMSSRRLKHSNIEPQSLTHVGTLKAPPKKPHFPCQLLSNGKSTIGALWDLQSWEKKKHFVTFDFCMFFKNQKSVTWVLVSFVTYLALATSCASLLGPFVTRFNKPKMLIMQKNGEAKTNKQNHRGMFF